MKAEYSMMLWETLSAIGSLESSQQESHHSNQIGHPISFSFRFKDVEYDAEVYANISAILAAYRGSVRWICHQKGSRKNRTIEPLDFYNARVKQEKYGEWGSKQINHIKGFDKTNKRAYKELPIICELISSVSLHGK